MELLSVFMEGAFKSLFSLSSTHTPERSGFASCFPNPVVEQIERIMLKVPNVLFALRKADEDATNSLFEGV